MSVLLNKIPYWFLRMIDWFERSSLQTKLNSKYITIGSGFSFDKYLSIEVPDGSFSFIVKDDVIIRKFCNITIHQGGILKFGNKVFFNNYCSINCLQRISIGDNTLFGEGVKLYDHNHEYHYQNELLTVEREKFKKGFIEIGKNCWIGSNVTILNNVHIGDNVIIGANTLIHKSVPSGVIIRSQSDLLINSLDGK